MPEPHISPVLGPGDPPWMSGSEAIALGPQVSFSNSMWASANGEPELAFIRKRPSSIFCKPVTVVLLTWGYLHHRNWQMIQNRGFLPSVVKY